MAETKGSGSDDKVPTADEVAVDEQFIDEFGPQWAATVDKDGE